VAWSAAAVNALLPLEGLVELGTTTIDDVARARAYVTVRCVVCRDCGEDDRRRLVFLHGAPGASVWDRRVWQLVALGASNQRLAMELAKCVSVCRRCLMRRIARPKMLRVVETASMRVVAKVPIARCGGRNPEPPIVTRRSIESLSDRSSLTE